MMVSPQRHIEEVGDRKEAKDGTNPILPPCSKYNCSIKKQSSDEVMNSEFCTMTNLFLLFSEPNKENTNF
jgi:SET domain-containing protein